MYASLCVGAATAEEVDGVHVGFVDYTGPATLSVKATGQFELQISIHPKTEQDTLTVGVELPISGANRWPIVDVQVLDSDKKAVPVRRGGITWHKLLITIPPEPATLIVHAIDPMAHMRPRIHPEKARHATDTKTGLRATINRWHGGRQAALSIRFDDSHATHLSRAIPILNAYGFRGTFMINPGGHRPDSRVRSAFEDHRAQWEAVARRGAHEFANHTMNHRGAESHEAMEHEVGNAAKAIWDLFPTRSRLMALNLGGGTQWVTPMPLRFYLDKYHLFDASSNSTGMDDVYGDRVAVFRRLLETHIERGLWYKVHYHGIGEGHGASEAHFRAAMDVAKEHEGRLWIAGMADIYKYQAQRLSARLEMEHMTDSTSRLKLWCATEPTLYDQPLTVEVAIPESWATQHVRVTDSHGEDLETVIVSDSESAKLRFDVEPVDSHYTIQKTGPSP